MLSRRWRAYTGGFFGIGGEIPERSERRLDHSSVELKSSDEKVFIGMGVTDSFGFNVLGNAAEVPFRWISARFGLRAPL